MTTRKHIPDGQKHLCTAKQTRSAWSNIFLQLHQLRVDGQTKIGGEMAQIDKVDQQPDKHKGKAFDEQRANEDVCEITVFLLHE